MGIVLMGVLSSCATVRVDGFTINEMDWERCEKALRSRAAFDLECDAAKLKLQLLSTGQDALQYDKAHQVGVAGCGKKVVYVRLANGWAANGGPGNGP